MMKPNAWRNLPPLAKTILLCVIIEAAVFGLLLLFTRSGTAAMVIQIIVFGPPSIFFAPWLLRRFRDDAAGRRGPRA